MNWILVLAMTVVMVMNLWTWNVTEAVAWGVAIYWVLNSMRLEAIIEEGPRCCCELDTYFIEEEQEKEDE